MPDQRKENRFALALVALHGMCVGGTVLASLFEDAPTESEKESKKKSAQEIARASVMLADAMVSELEKSSEASA